MNLQISNDIRSGASFHILVCHLLWSGVCSDHLLIFKNWVVFVDFKSIFLYILHSGPCQACVLQIFSPSLFILLVLCPFYCNETEMWGHQRDRSQSEGFTLCLFLSVATPSGPQWYLLLHSVCQRQVPSGCQVLHPELEQLTWQWDWALGAPTSSPVGQPGAIRGLGPADPFYYLPRRQKLWAYGDIPSWLLQPYLGHRGLAPPHCMSRAVHRGEDVSWLLDSGCKEGSSVQMCLLSET